MPAAVLGSFRRVGKHRSAIIYIPGRLYVKPYDMWLAMSGAHKRRGPRVPRFKISAGSCDLGSKMGVRTAVVGGPLTAPHGFCPSREHVRAHKMSCSRKGKLPTDFPSRAHLPFAIRRLSNDGHITMSLAIRPMVLRAEFVLCALVQQ